MERLERLTRIKHRIFDVPKNEKSDNFGNEGENIVYNMLKKYNYDFIKYNPVFPDPKNKSKYLETDIIIYHKDEIFCIEVKNFKGSISIEEDYITNKRKLVQKKTGKYGEDIQPKIHKDPLSKTNAYIGSLKEYLSVKDKRFGRRYIHSLVAFNRDICNLDEVYEDEYIYFDQIDKYIKNKTISNKKNKEWCEKLLNNLPSWDILTTMKNQKIYGLIIGEFLYFQDRTNKKYRSKKENISYITISNDGFFSKENRLIIKYSDGKTKEFKNIHGKVEFFNKSGNKQVVDFDTLKKINIESNKLKIIEKK